MLRTLQARHHIKAQLHSDGAIKAREEGGWELSHHRSQRARSVLPR